MIDLAAKPPPPPQTPTAKAWFQSVSSPRFSPCAHLPFFIRNSLAFTPNTVTKIFKKKTRRSVRHASMRRPQTAMFWSFSSQKQKNMFAHLLLHRVYLAVLATLNKALARSFWGHKPAACFAECLGSPGRVGGGAGNSIVFLGSPGVFCLPMGGQVLGVVLGGGGETPRTGPQSVTKKRAARHEVWHEVFPKKNTPIFPQRGRRLRHEENFPAKLPLPGCTPRPPPRPLCSAPSHPPQPLAHAPRPPPPPAFPGRKARRLWDETPAGFCPKETKC